MSQTPPPGYTPPPADLPQRGDRATFSNRVDAWVTWFSTVILTQLAAIVANAYANALDAYASAVSALGAKTAAETARDTAQGYRDQALTYRDAAEDSAAAAAASAASAAALAGAFVGTSASSLTIGLGNKTFATQAGEQYTPGIFMTAVSNANGANWMAGQVVSYSGTSLVLDITATGGSGTFADWNLSLAGVQGAQGPAGSLTGGNLTGALNEIKSSAPASSATPDIWGAAGNYVPITSTTTVTGFPAAPQAGARRTIQVGATFDIVDSANLTVHGGSLTLYAGDEVDVVADTTTTFRATVRRADGTPTAVVAFRFMEFLDTNQTWVAKTTGAHRITLVAAAGSSGVAFAAANGQAAASGASCGGTAVKVFVATQGDSYALTFGAKGAPVAPSYGTAADGNNAVASTFTGHGLNITCNGGLGGKAAVAASGVGCVALGVAGGTASGGDKNYTGGGSGTATIGANNNSAAATGGGAINYSGQAYSSGAATLSTSGQAYAATGGAGVAGGSGTATATSSSAGSGGGGTAAGTSPNSTTQVSPGGPGTPTWVQQTPLIFTGAGSSSSATTSTATMYGPGTGGVPVGVTGTSIEGGRVTYAGGAGGLAGSSSATIGFSGGGVIYGGAPGGVAFAGTPTARVEGSNPGAAFAIIEWN